jgi:MoxR-like ATPase
VINSEKTAALYQKVLNEVSRVIIGKGEIKETLVLALIARGHVLIEGLPGSAKTKLARTFAQAIGGEFKRIQLTPDMMPQDITGFYLYSPDGTFRFIQGPVFANIVLADELNRTTPRTQSAMLEAMAENQVTIEQKTHPLPRPFMVIATQVGAGGEGTYPLTDVQTDRFLLRVTSQYASEEEEKQIMASIDDIDALATTEALNLEEIAELQSMGKQVQVAPGIIEYIVRIVNSLRSDPDVLVAPSTRGSISLYKCSRAIALLDGRDFVIPDDVKLLAARALGHRIRVKAEAEMDDITPGVILERTLHAVPIPRLEI